MLDTNFQPAAIATLLPNRRQFDAARLNLLGADVTLDQFFDGCLRCAEQISGERSRAAGSRRQCRRGKGERIRRRTDQHEIRAGRKNGQNFFVAHAHGDRLCRADQIDLVLAPLPHPQIRRGLQIQHRPAARKFLHRNEHVGGVGRGALPQHLRHQTVGGKLRRRRVAQHSRRDAGRRVLVELDVLLLGKHAHARFGQLALQAAIGGVQERQQHRVGEDRAGIVVEQRARQRERVFSLRIGGCRNDGHGCLREILLLFERSSLRSNAI